MNDKEYRGNIEITGKNSSEEGGPLKWYDVEIRLDGKVLPGVQVVDFYVAVEKDPYVILKIHPSEIKIDIKDIEIIERRKE